MTENLSLKFKLKNYPDWDREKQIKRNRLALERLDQRRKAIFKITDHEAKEREIFSE